MSDLAVCRGVTSKGEPCRTRLGLVDGLCIAHDENRAEEARQMRSDGARAANASRREARAQREAMLAVGAPKTPRTFEEMERYGGWALEEHAAGRMNEKDVKAIAGMLRELRATLKEREKYDGKMKALQDKCARLEKMAEARST